MHPRPILVTLTRVSDVRLILSKHFSTNPIKIKPDLPPEQRKIRSILLTERRSLIDNHHTDSKSIRLRGDCLYLGNRLHGKVIDGSMVGSDSLGDHAPALVEISDQSQSETISNSDFDIFIITETWLSKDFHDNEFAPLNYSAYNPSI